ncbi:MAG: sigma-70 family RNA polymerase sigma factor [Nibricoccus sp.]
MTTTPITETGTPTDEDLMVALQGGQDAALASLMERWELPVKAFLQRLGVPAADVEDVAQEAFVKLYETRARFHAGSAFKPWLLTLAGNLGRNRLRWRFRRREDSIEAIDAAQAGGFQPADPTAMTGAVVAEKNALRQTVRAAVEALPNNLREAVVCVELEEMSYNDAAQVMKCSTKAVETRLYRARQLLRTTLQSWLTKE